MPKPRHSYVCTGSMPEEVKAEGFGAQLVSAVGSWHIRWEAEKSSSRRHQCPLRSHCHTGLAGSQHGSLHPT